MARKFLNGNAATAYAVKLCRAEVVAAYPITPQTKIVEKVAELIADGEMEAEYVKVESEHSAMSACLGASSTGARVFTATSSQGLAYMHEMLHYVAGGRFPVVMAVVNRSLGPPWGIWVDHQDSISNRDTGWIQFYVESAQEALDATIMAFRVAEDPEVLTPVMICSDAFIVSHTDEPVDAPDQEEVDAYLPPYRPADFMDVDNPKTFCAGVAPDGYMEVKYQQQLAIQRSAGVIRRACREFAGRFGRDYGDLVEEYRCDGARAVLVALGSSAGTAREVVDRLREEGLAAGLLRVRSFRPFPADEIRRVARNAGAIGVLDRDVSYGYEGAVFSEVKAALYGQETAPPVLNFVAGLGGRDITAGDIREMFVKILEAQGRAPAEGNSVEFVGVRFG